MISRADAIVEKALDTLTAWIGSPDYKEKKTGEILRYAVCAGLAVCEHAKYFFPLKRKSFVAQNMDELAKFNRASFLKLLRTYNTRGDAIEPEKSLLLEIPGRLES